MKPSASPGVAASPAAAAPLPDAGLPMAATGGGVLSAGAHDDVRSARPTSAALVPIVRAGLTGLLLRLVVGFAGAREGRLVGGNEARQPDARQRIGASRRGAQRCQA